MIGEFNYNSVRAQKARIATFLKGMWVRILQILGLVLLAGGLLVVLIGQSSVGWLIASLFVIPVMIVFWYKGELEDLQIHPDEKTIDAILEGEVLGRLPKNPTPIDIATAAMQVPSGHFLAARFGISPTLLHNITPQIPSKTHTVWAAAEEVRERIDAKKMTGAMLIVALLLQYEDHEVILAHNHTDIDELIEGVKWRSHVDDLIREFHIPRRTGGIARDWSFGYTPLLERHAHNISQKVSRGNLLAVETEHHLEIIDRIVDHMGENGKRNAVLVGAAGVGKTAIIESFAERLVDASSKIPDNLRFRQVFMLDSASLVAAAPGRGELEKLVIQIINEAYNAKNIILCFDNAQLFFEESVGSVDLSNVLQPLLEDGAMRIILSMDQQKFLQIGQRNPALFNSVNRVAVEPSDEQDTMHIMQDQLLGIEARRKVVYTYQSLKEAYRLSKRYMHELSMPGRALRLLESSASFAESGVVTINSVQAAIEKTANVKVSVASEANEREKLLHLEDEIHTRMIGQERAVQVVSDALRRARVGVRNENRPIGTFLFLGPTGVGKTELSKALSEVYFGGESSIIRLDLNEFVQASDVSRLIADGADDPHSLTAQVLRQPFSVILLDEIEKAAPEVLTTLLQLLDEGILRDVKNREVSFRDAIIIATSNAGADRIREYVERGYQVSQFEAQFMDELIASNMFKPEFLNRFDEIVIFSPLSKQNLFSVVDLMLEGVNKTLQPQKIRVEVEERAKAILVNRGYDPRLGARPMRRVIQKAVENTVAKAMLSGQANSGSVVTISTEDVATSLGDSTKKEIET